MSDEKLTQVFDLTPVEKVEVVKTPIPDNKEADIETARQVHHELLDTSKDALQNLLDFAKASESPRAYEIVSDLIRTTSDVAKTLVDINTKYKKTEEPINQTNIQQNIVFNGSTAELQKMIKDINKKD
jgi:hypothetical protein